MAVEYDLIVIGNTTAGIHAAVCATQLKARVALVDQDTEEISISHHAFQEAGRISRMLDRANQLNFHEQASFNPPQWSKVKRWADAIAHDAQALNSPAVLTSLGIEWIVGSGEFVRKPQCGFVVNGRLLRSRSFLIATGSTLRVPNIEGLQSTNYLTSKTAFQILPSKLVIIGSEAIAVELAQIYTRLGSQVTLIATQILAEVDREAAFLIQAQLEAEGVRVVTEKATQIRQIQDKKWVQAGDQAIETNEILLATGWQPKLEGLNLEATGIQLPLRINSKLQTTNPCIYWCQTRHEAGVAVENALFFPVFKVDDHHVPKTIFSSPEVSWIGLTETQAIQEYDRDIFVLRQYFKTLEKAQIQGETTGFCKMIVRRNGVILGAHIVGSEASELMGIIAIAMQKKLKIGAIANLAFPLPTLSEILGKVAADFQYQKLQRNSRFRDFLEGLFGWRRKRSNG